MKLSNQKKKLYAASTFLFLSLQENQLSYRNDFDIIKCAFRLCILCPNLNIFIHIIAMVKLKKTNQKLERGEKPGKKACFCNVYYRLYILCVNKING